MVGLQRVEIATAANVITHACAGRGYSYPGGAADERGNPASVPARPCWARLPVRADAEPNTDPKTCTPTGPALPALPGRGLPHRTALAGNPLNTSADPPMHPHRAAT
jgi:hypothetical protein